LHFFSLCISNISNWFSKVNHKFHFFEIFVDFCIFLIYFVIFLHLFSSCISNISNWFSKVNKKNTFFGIFLNFIFVPFYKYITLIIIWKKQQINSHYLLLVMFSNLFKYSVSMFLSNGPILPFFIFINLSNSLFKTISNSSE